MACASLKTTRLIESNRKAHSWPTKLPLTSGKSRYGVTCQDRKLTVDGQNYHFLMKVYKALPPTGDEEFDAKEAAPPTPAGTEDTAAAPTSSNSEAMDGEDSYAARAKRLRSILDGRLLPRLHQLHSRLWPGSIPTSLYLHWLFGQNKTDLNILQNIKVCCSAASTSPHVVAG